MPLEGWALRWPAPEYLSGSAVGGFVGLGLNTGEFLLEMASKPGVNPGGVGCSSFGRFFVGCDDL